MYLFNRVHFLEILSSGNILNSKENNMKILITSFLILFFACPAFAFQAVSTSKSNFGASAQNSDDNKDKSAVPGTRTFSTYVSQQHNWSKGVETKPAQIPQPTQQQVVTAGAEAAAADAQFTPSVQLPAAKQQQAGEKKKEAADNENNKKQAVPAAKSFQKATTPQQAQEAESQNAQQAMQANQQDTAKMMQSLQGLMGGMAGGTTGGQAGGMPDISALMNSFGGGTPQGQQTKK